MPVEYSIHKHKVKIIIKNRDNWLTQSKPMDQFPMDVSFLK